MRKIYINPQGVKHYSMPRSLVLNGNTYCPPTEEQLTEAGWTIEEIIDPIPEPYVPTVEELVERALRYGEDGGSPTYSINQEFEVQRKRDTEPAEYATYYNRVESCIAWAKSLPHREEE